MAQLFTIHFPKYYFDLQKEFSIEFAFPLPFEYVVEDGCCYVSAVHYDQQNEGDPYYWHKKALQPGLRVITINNKSLMDDDNHSDDNLLLTEEAIQDLLAIADTQRSITIHFREEVSPEDFSIPLGLAHTQPDIDETKDDKTDECTLSPTALSPVIRHNTGLSMPSIGLSNLKSKSSNARPFNQEIKDSQIGASSFTQDYEPWKCRLNHPHSYWQPSEDDLTTLDTWLRIDLGMTKMVTRLHIQGSPDHSSYVKSFWIDYSDDCCQWMSHPLGEIKCQYKNHDRMKAKASTQSLHNLGLIEQDMNDIYAEIHMWPAITARFVRLRPYSVCNKVAVRLELYGFAQVVAAANLAFARVVTLYDVNEMDKKKLMERVTNLPANTKVIQVDCKAVISAALDRAGLTSVGFLKADADNFICVFTTAAAGQSERALDELADVGVGREMGVISTTAIAFRNEPKKSHSELIVKNKHNKKSATFSDSVKSRMIVAQVVERIMNSSAFTFDYVCMLIVASLIAAGGLATDNSVIVVASMLVSPLMGPVLAFTFGVTLKEANMAKLGLKNELLSLLICVISGFVVGFLYSLLSQNANNWPTQQMSSRGTVAGLADGAFIAAASGVGVALSVLGDYLSTVVGVAISASLLPPAVNCGMLFAFPIITTMYPKWIQHDNRHETKKLLEMAGLSLLLTIENIIIIFAVSRLMFWIKNVYITKDHHEKVWKSVTNFRQNYNRLTAIRHMQSALTKAVTIITDPEISTVSTPRSPNEYGTLDERMRQQMDLALTYDFGKNSNTIKGGVLVLNRQRSMNLLSMKHQKTLNIYLDDSANKSSKDVHDQSNDSDKSDVEEEDKDNKKHVGVNDLFTAEKVASLRTPHVGDDDLIKRFDYDALVPLAENDDDNNIAIYAENTPSLKNSSQLPLVGNTN